MEQKDHDLIVTHIVKLDNIDKTTQRIEHKLDCFDSRLRKKVDWSHLGIVAAVFGAIWGVIRWVPVAIASLL